jgi:putative drug exporter of the RND superfamily
MSVSSVGTVARIGRWCYRRRGWTAAIWAVGLVALMTISGVVGSDYAEDFEIPESGSRSGIDVLTDHFEGFGTGFTAAIVFQAEQGATDPTVSAAMSEMFAAVAELDMVDVRSPYEGFGGGITDDGTIGFAEVEISLEMTFNEMMLTGEAVRELIPDVDGLRVEIGGEALAGFEPPQSELIGVAFAIFVLILSFGSVLAMGLPISVALAGVTGGVGLVALLSQLTTIPEFALTISIMIGLGVGIDYALFIVTRYRERLHAGDSHLDALVLAMDTSGRAVIFAGTTVVISLLGMLLIGLSFVSGLALSAVTAVLMTMIAAITLLPALIGFVGDRIEVTRWRSLIAAAFVAVALIGMGLSINALLIGAPLAAVVLIAGFAFAPLKREVKRKPPQPLQETLAYRFSRFVQHRPWTIAISAALFLIFLALPLLGLRLGFSDEGNFAEETTTRQAYDLLAEGFGPGFNGPLLITAEGTSEDLPTVLALVAALRETPGVASASDPFPNDFVNPSAVLIQVIPETAPQDEATYELVSHLREDVIPPVVAGTGLDPYVTGNVAVAIDFTDYLSGRTWFFFAAVLALSFVLLMIVFRSVLIPIKAVVMNLLSISAAYGVVIALFQWGWLGGLTGLEPAPIEPFIPMMMFAVVFGLSMDYEVFLLSRIREEYLRTGDPTGSVADGLAATARVITAAAAIMVVVFGAFLFEDARVIKLFGVGLGFAVLVDATVVRMLLVPATMELLGTKNWWIPQWLDRILPKVSFEGGE